MGVTIASIKGTIYQKLRHLTKMLSLETHSSGCWWHKSILPYWILLGVWVSGFYSSAASYYLLSALLLANIILSAFNFKTWSSRYQRDYWCKASKFELENNSSWQNGSISKYKMVNSECKMGQKCGTFANVRILEYECEMGCNWHIRAPTPHSANSHPAF